MKKCGEVDVGRANLTRPATNGRARFAPPILLVIAYFLRLLARQDLKRKGRYNRYGPGGLAARHRAVANPEGSCPVISETVVRRAVLFVGLLSALSGCATHRALRDDTVKPTNTLADFKYQQVLDN